MVPGAAKPEALGRAEQQVNTLPAGVQSMEAAKRGAFTSPPRAWITDRIGELNHLLGTRTEKSALALRRLTGAITLSPQKPEVGRPNYRASRKFDALNLLVEDGGSNLLRWWRRRESNPGPRGVRAAFVHVCSRSEPPDGFCGFGHNLASRVFSPRCPVGTTAGPALVIAPFRYQDDLAVGRLRGFLGRESECVIVRS
jgi:hypothetical protein